MSKRWKTYELKVARFFGTERTPLSGINSRHDTSSDTLHASLYLEAKSVSTLKSSNGWILRWLTKLGFPRGMVSCRITEDDWLYVLHSSALDEDPPVPEQVGKPPAACMRLWEDTLGKAVQEQKAALLALFCKGKRGFWLVGSAQDMLVAIEERRRVKGGSDEVD